MDLDSLQNNYWWERDILKFYFHKSDKTTYRNIYTVHYIILLYSSQDTWRSNDTREIKKVILIAR